MTVEADNADTFLRVLVGLTRTMVSHRAQLRHLDRSGGTVRHQVGRLRESGGSDFGIQDEPPDGEPG